MCDSLCVVLPTRMKMKRIQPLGRRPVQNVKGTRSPFSSTRTMRNCPAAALAATAGASTVMSKTEPDSCSVASTENGTAYPSSVAVLGTGASDIQYTGIDARQGAPSAKRAGPKTRPRNGPAAVATGTA